MLSVFFLADLTVLAENVIKNPGFEFGEEGWRLFLPSASIGTQAVEWEVIKKPGESRQGQFLAALTGTEPIRWGIFGNTLGVSEGQKYRISAWVKFNRDAEIQDSGRSPVYLRATMLDDSGQDVYGNAFGHFHIGLSGEVAGNAKVDSLKIAKLPTEWRKIEGVIQILEGASKLHLVLFTNGVTGTVYWDDVSIEQVPDETPLSRILD